MTRPRSSFPCKRAAGVAGLLIGALVLSGCAEGGLAGGLRAAGVGDAPDEFLVLPTKPLELPEDLSSLPPPTPGALNRVEKRPDVDAVAALTGRPVAAGTASAGGLLAQAGPVDPQIRGRLAAEDTEFRAENRGPFLERLANRGAQDSVIYQDVQLDADAEFERLRARGLRVPAAPPRVP